MINKGFDNYGVTIAEKLHDNWYGGNLAGYGLYVTGPTRNVSSNHDTFANWDTAIYLNGNAADNSIVEEAVFFGDAPNTTDLHVVSTTQTIVRGGLFTGTNSIVEGAGVTGYVTGARFVNTPTLSNLAYVNQVSSSGNVGIGNCPPSALTGQIELIA